MLAATAEAATAEAAEAAAMEAAKRAAARDTIVGVVVVESGDPAENAAPEVVAGDAAGEAPGDAAGSAAVMPVPLALAGADVGIAARWFGMAGHIAAE